MSSEVTLPRKFLSKKRFTYWTMRGLVSNWKGLFSLAEMAWCLARDISTSPLSPGSFVSFISSTSHFPTRHTKAHTQRHLQRSFQGSTQLRGAQVSRAAVFQPAPHSGARVFIPPPTRIWQILGYGCSKPGAYSPSQSIKRTFHFQHTTQ